MHERSGPLPASAGPSSDDQITRNIRQIAQLENERAERLSRSDMIAARISRAAGSLRFAVCQVVFFGTWLWWNTRGPVRFRFDPFPFGMVTLLISLESVMLAVFVLMAQNRQGREADRRNHLALQISVLAEQEMTAVLRQVDAIARRVGAAPAGRVDEHQQMMADTELSEVIKRIDEEMPHQS